MRGRFVPLALSNQPYDPRYQPDWADLARGLACFVDGVRQLDAVTWDVEAGIVVRAARNPDGRIAVYGGAIVYEVLRGQVVLAIGC